LHKISSNNKKKKRENKKSNIPGIGYWITKKEFD